MLKLWNSIRAPFCWKPQEFSPARDYAVPVEVQYNAAHGRYRWRYLGPTNAVPETWRSGLPPIDLERPKPPSGGTSGVKPKSEAPKLGAATDDLLRRFRDAVPEGLKLEPGMKVDEPSRRLAITPAPKGGYMVGREDRSFGSPIFKTLYAGDLSDCLNFIESEMEAAA